MKYKLAVTGWEVVEVEAKSPEDAELQLFEQGLNNLYASEVAEVVPADQEFEMYTDLN